MPYSNDTFDYYIGTVIELLRPSVVYDVGAGAGKYGKLIRSIAERSGFETRTIGVEIDNTYVTEFGLAEIYDELLIGDAIRLIDDPKIRADLVLIGDCIEHMRKSTGTDLLNFLIYRAGYICIIYPEAYVQDDWQGHA